MNDIREERAMNDKERMERYREALSECIHEINRMVPPLYTNTLEIAHEITISEWCRGNPHFIECDPRYIAEMRRKAIEEAIDECVKKKMEQDGF